MKNWLISILAAIVFVLIGWFANLAWHLPRGSNPISGFKPRPLEKYTIKNLSNIKVEAPELEIGDILKDDSAFTSYEFFITFDPTLSDNQKKKVSGMLNIPKGDDPFPLIVMLRGFVEAETYFIGQGTVRGAEYFAKNGFITISPDFLGYGNSDGQPPNVFESRFQTYTTTLALLKSLDSIDEWDNKNIFIWGHSNGGQVALSVLEITGATYPTVLWAPVSKPFPYSILYFTDSPGDYGKSLRRELANFEEDYDTDLFSIHKYFDRIMAPLQLNQGGVDPNVPKAWSDELSKTFSELKIDLDYNVYPNNDHNMQPGWNTVVQDNLKFFKEHLVK